MRRISTAIILSVLFPILSAGCRQPLPPSELDDLADASGDGFVDVVPPQGVMFDESSNVSVRLENSVAQADLAVLAQANGVDPSLLNLVAIVGRVNVELHYDGGETDTIEESLLIEPFIRSFEVACPAYVDATAAADVYPPAGGPTTLFESEPIRFVEGEDYTCGQTIAYAAFLNADGEPMIEPLE